MEISSLSLLNRLKRSFCVSKSRSHLLHLIIDVAQSFPGPLGLLLPMELSVNESHRVGEPLSKGRAVIDRLDVEDTAVFDTGHFHFGLEAFNAGDHMALQLVVSL